MRWFGTTWNAYVNLSCEEIGVPSGERCEYCHKRIEARDSGFELPLTAMDGDTRTEVYYHKDCLLRSVGALS